MLSLILKDVREDSFTSVSTIPPFPKHPDDCTARSASCTGAWKEFQRVFYCDGYIELVAGEFSGCPVGTGRVFPPLFILLVVEDRRPHSDGGVCWANGEEKYCAQAELWHINASITQTALRYWSWVRMKSARTVAQRLPGKKKWTFRSDEPWAWTLWSWNKCQKTWLHSNWRLVLWCLLRSPDKDAWMWHLSKAAQTWHILLYLQALNVSPVRWSFLLCWHDKHLAHRGEIHLQFLIVSLSQCHVIIIIIIMLCSSREKVIDGSAKLISEEEGFPLVSDRPEIARWACLLRVRNGGTSVSRRLRPTGGVSLKRQNKRRFGGRTWQNGAILQRWTMKRWGIGASPSPRPPPCGRLGWNESAAPSALVNRAPPSSRKSCCVAL